MFLHRCRLGFKDRKNNLDLDTLTTHIITRDINNALINNLLTYMVMLYHNLGTLACMDNISNNNMLLLLDMHHSNTFLHTRMHMFNLEMLAYLYSLISNPDKEIHRPLANSMHQRPRLPLLQCPLCPSPARLS